MSAKIPQTQSQSTEFNQYQVQVGKALQLVLANPINFGTALTGIELAIGINTIPHKLNRKLQGWIITRQVFLQGTAAIDIGIQDGQDHNNNTGQTLVLYSTQPVTIDLWVF